MAEHTQEFQRIRTEDRRLAILRFLEEEPDYRISVSLLQDALELCAHSVSRDVIMADGDWLHEVGLVEPDMLGNIPMLKLTSRGADVAKGRVKVSGVKRPAPK